MKKDVFIRNRNNEEIITIEADVSRGKIRLSSRTDSGEISISPGNDKLGKVPNLSLPPIVTCNPLVGCKGDCYAKYNMERFPLVKHAWEGNLHTLQAFGPEAFFEGIKRFLQRKRKLPLFRFHVGGDLPSPRYFHHLCNLVRDFPNTKFLLYTKRYDFVIHEDYYDFVIHEDYFTRPLPPNLVVVFSVYPDQTEDGLPSPQEIRKTGFPIGYLLDPYHVDPYIPGNSFICPGDKVSCDRCRFCFNLRRGEGKSVVFRIHGPRVRGDRKLTVRQAKDLIRSHCEIL